VTEKAGRATRASVETPPRPRTVDGVLVAAGVFIACSLLSALTWYGFKSQFIDLLIRSDRKAKNPTPGYGAAQAADDLDKIRKGQLVQTFVVCLALAFLTYAITRARSASAGRWGLVIVLVLTVNAVIPVNGLPALANGLRVVALLAALTVVVLLFLPASRRYFAQCRVAVTGGEPTRSGGLRGLFSNGMPQRQVTPRQTTERVDATVAANGDARQAGSKSRAAKARTEQAAVARGAELARSRAKASKSRRSDG
jgi:hypothetical protein